MENVYLFSPDTLQSAVRKILSAAGSPDPEAALISERLVKANLTAHDSHGVMRMHQYMEALRGGVIQPGRKAEMVLDSGSTAVLKGNRGFGQTIATEAMRVAITKAKEFNLAAVGVTDLHHVGRLADYVVLAAQQDLVALMFTATGGFNPLVAPYGGSARRMATNPFAAAFPSDRESPIVMDFASSTYAEGKFRVMRDAGGHMPPNVLLDKDGKPSVDPNDLYGGGAIRPLGGDQGYKGYLLNFLIEVLGGILTDGGYMGKEEKPPFNNSSLMIVLNVAFYRALPDFKQELEGLIAYLKGTREAEGQHVLYPGEKEALMEQKRRAAGIPLPKTTVEELQFELDHFKVGGNLLSQGKESKEAIWGQGAS